MTAAAPRALRDEAYIGFAGPGGEAEAGQTNVVRAFAQPVNARLVYTICETRRERAKFLPGKLLGEPAWDMMLELYAAELDQQRMSITRLSRRSGIPATTVLRFLGLLVEAGLVKRENDPTDARRVYVALSPSGMQAMNCFFAASGSRAVFL